MAKGGHLASTIKEQPETHEDYHDIQCHHASTIEEHLVAHKDQHDIIIDELRQQIQKL